jgi:hypothetical protein
VIARTGGSSGMSADMVTASVAPVAGSNVPLIAGARTTYLVTSPPAFLGDSPGWTALATADQLAQPAYLVVSSANGAYTNDFRWDTAEPYDTVIVAFIATGAP